MSSFICKSWCISVRVFFQNLIGTETRGFGFWTNPLRLEGRSFSEHILDCVSCRRKWMENILKVTAELQGGFWREYFQMEVAERYRACKGNPPRCKFAAYFDTQAKADREKETWSCLDRFFNGFCALGPIIDHSEWVLLWVLQYKAESCFWS